MSSVENVRGKAKEPKNLPKEKFLPVKIGENNKMIVLANIKCYGVGGEETRVRTSFALNLEVLFILGINRA